MGAVFDVAIEYEHIKDKPTKNITLPKNVIVREMKPFSPQEVESLISNAEGWFKNFITFCFYTGMRHGEIIALNWSDIDFENLIINVNKRVKQGKTDTPKTKSGIRKIPIFKPLLPFLKNQLQLSKQSKSLKVFTNPNTQKAAQALQALGFKVKEADRMLNAINDDTLTTEELIRLALQNK